MSVLFQKPFHFITPAADILQLELVNVYTFTQLD